MCTHTCISHECQEQGSAGTGTQHTRSFIAVGSGANVTAQEEPLSSPRNCPLPHNDSCLVPVGFGSFNNGSWGYSRTLCFVYFHLPHWMCPWFESFIWKKKLRWDAFSQCSLFHGARDWVQGLPIIIRLNIKTGKFWEGKKKKKNSFAPRHLPFPAAYSIPKVILLHLVFLFLQRFLFPAFSELSACLSR